MEVKVFSLLGNLLKFAMNIHLLSDIHLENADYAPVQPDADLIVLAGDIHNGTKAFDWARWHYPHDRVIYVPGNHEFYGGHFERTLDALRARSDDHVRLMDMDEIRIGKVRILAGTGWTDFQSTGNQPIAMWDAEQGMNDYQQIRTTKDYRKLKPTDVARRAAEFKSWLNGKFAEPFDGKTVVVTHHAPMIAPCAYREPSHLDAAFSNNWPDLVEQADLWLYGHTHQADDFTVGRCRLVSNPVGYAHENTGYDYDQVINL